MLWPHIQYIIIYCLRYQWDENRATDKEETKIIIIKSECHIAADGGCGFDCYLPFAENECTKNEIPFKRFINCA